MISTSKAYREKVTGDSGSREFCIADKVTFTDGTQITLSLDDVISYSINDATTESGKFQIGAAIIKEYSIVLNNFDGKFDGYTFDGADICADIGLKLDDGTWEILRKGKFRIVNAVGVETINVTAYDSMLFFDRPYSDSTLQYPATINEIIQDACNYCQMTFDASSVQMGNYVVKERPDSSGITFRDVISYTAQIMGCYARINRLDMLEFGWYAFGNGDTIWGGIFDNGSPYETGSDVDGGKFRPWNTGDVHTEDFSSMREYHHLYDLKQKNINTEDIEITGVKVIIKKTGNTDTVEANYGDEGYVVAIENNPFIQSKEDAQAVVQHVGAKISHSCFRPMNIAVQSDPAIEAGDSVIVSYGNKLQSIFTVITNTTFSIGGSQKVICSAETKAEKKYKKYNAQTRILLKAQQEAEEQLVVYDIAVKQMNQLAANTMGFFATTVTQDDGSAIVYRHNKEKLKDSKIVYKSSIDGFWVTQDYQGTDEATTSAGKWKAGFDSNGNATLNMLSVIGINFDWAHGGTLTLGGVSNGDGLLRILDSSGTQIGYIDNEGVHFTKGEFSGTVKAGKVEGSEISGTHIKTYDEWGSGNGIEIERGKLIFFWEGEEFGVLEPDYDGILDEETGELTKLFSLFISCDISAKNVYQWSDERKKNIIDWDESYDDVLMDLEPILFTWKNNTDKRVHLGLGAQKTKNVLQNHNKKNVSIVNGSDNNGYSIDYTEIFTILISSVQKNRKMIKELQEEIENLKKMIKEE